MVRVCVRSIYWGRKGRHLKKSKSKMYFCRHHDRLCILFLNYFLSRNSQQNEKKSATNLLSFCNVEANGWSVTQLTCGWSVTQLTCGYISVLVISLTDLVDGGRQFVCNTNSNLIEEKLQALLFKFFFKNWDLLSSD